MAEFQLAPGVTLTPQEQAAIAAQGHQVVAAQGAPAPVAPGAPSRMPVDQAQRQFGGELYRAANQDVARVGAQQENTLAGAGMDFQQLRNSLSALGHAYRLVNNGDTPTGGPNLEAPDGEGHGVIEEATHALGLGQGRLPFARGVNSFWASKGLGPIAGVAGAAIGAGAGGLPGAAIGGIAGLLGGAPLMGAIGQGPSQHTGDEVQNLLAGMGLSLSTNQTANLGRLEKQSQLFQGLAAGNFGASPTQSGKLAAGSTFGIDKDRQTNVGAIQNLLQQQLGLALQNRAAHLWVDKFGDVNHVIDAGNGVKITLPTYVAALTGQAPRIGPGVFDRARYSAAMPLSGGSRFELPGMGLELDGMVRALQGDDAGQEGYDPSKDTNAGAAEALRYLKQKHTPNAPAHAGAQAMSPGIAIDARGNIVR